MMQNPAGGGGLAKPKVRNPAIGFAPLVCFVLGNVLAGTLGGIAGLLSLAGLVLMFVLMIPMVAEVNAITGGSLAWWPLIVPFYNIYWCVVVLPKAVGEAKQRAASKTPAKGAAAYFFVTPWALASDLNDIANGA